MNLCRRARHQRPTSGARGRTPSSTRARPCPAATTARPRCRGLAPTPTTRRRAGSAGSNPRTAGSATPEGTLAPAPWQPTPCCTNGSGPALRSCSLIWSSTGISPLAMPPSTDRRVRVCRNSRPGLWPRRMEDWGTRRRGRWGDDGLSDAIATQLSLATSLSD